MNVQLPQVLGAYTVIEKKCDSTLVIEQVQIPHARFTRLRLEDNEFKPVNLRYG